MKERKKKKLQPISEPLMAATIQNRRQKKTTGDDFCPPPGCTRKRVSRSHSSRRPTETACTARANFRLYSLYGVSQKLVSCLSAAVS